MFRIDYANLNKKQVEELIGNYPAPTSRSPMSGTLNGQRLKIVLDEKPVAGPELEYEFISDVELTVRENGGSAVECRYGAMDLGPITLFTHMLPGKKYGYNVIINWETSVVTVLEMWFIDYEGTSFDPRNPTYSVFDANNIKPYINREVQRQFYYGYLEKEGEEPPETRDRLTLRLDNRMIDWKDDRGREHIVTYTTNIFSTLVEVNTPDGDDVLTFPSDNLQIDDKYFIYSRGEVEFSGRLVVDVLDVVNSKKIGVSMGIDEQNEFEYFMYRADGRCLGQTATFYDFNDKGQEYAETITKRMDYSVKGARCTYRPSIMAKALTLDEIMAAADNAAIYNPAKNHVMMAANRMKESTQCVGKKLFFRDDNGFAIEYSFTGVHDLEYRMEGEENWHKEIYRSSQLDDNLVILGHFRTGSKPPKCFILALDFANGCATCIDAVIGGKYETRDVTPTYHFGYIDMEGLTPPRLMRHGFTKELLGRSFTWTYSDFMTSQHIYNSPHSYSWTIFNNCDPGSPANRAGGFVWSSPCWYIKLRDNVYIMNWVEEKWEGIMGCAAMNLKMMHDCGFSFGVVPTGEFVVLDTMGALARDAGRYDMSGIYPLF